MFLRHAFFPFLDALGMPILTLVEQSFGLLFFESCSVVVGLWFELQGKLAVRTTAGTYAA